MFFKRKRMLKKEAAGWEGPAAEKNLVELQKVVERNVVITEEMANEMSTHITYLGTNLTARNQQEVPAFCDRSCEGFCRNPAGPS